MKVMRKALSALLLLLLFCGSAAANIAFTTVDANYTTAAVGVIDEELAASTVLSALASDHYATSFVKDGKRLFAFLEHDYTTGDRAFVYGDTRTWTSPANVVWTNAVNVHGVAQMNNFLYATSYGNGSVVQLNNSDYRATGRYYIHEEVPAGYKAHGEKVLAVDGKICVLFGMTSGSYPSLTYESSELVVLDSNLSASEAVFTLGSNAVDMAYIGGRKIAVACLGGLQRYGVNGSVQVVNLDAGKGEDALVSELELEAADTPLGAISAICADGRSNGGFYFIAQKYASAAAKYPTLTLYHWTGSTQYPVKVHDPVDVSGYSCRLVLDTARENRLFALMGDRIVAVNSNNDTVLRTFNSTVLGGNPSSIAVIDANIVGNAPDSGDGTGSGSGSGGGCDVSGFGVLALAALLGLRRRNVR